MEKKSLIIIFLIVLVTLGTCLYIKNVKEKFEDTYYVLKSRLLEANETLKKYSEEELLSFQTVNTPINIKDSIPFSLDKKTIYLRLHENICISCYTEHIIQLIKFSYENKFNIVLIASYNSRAAFNEIKKFFDIQYTINDSKYDLPADKCGVPYIFVKTENGMINHLLFFKKNDDFLKRFSIWFNMVE